MANDGTALTVNGEALVYTDDGNGGAIAVDADVNTVFPVEVDPDTLSYTVEMFDALDGVTKTTDFFDSTGSGIAHEEATFNVTADLLLKVSANARDGNVETTEAASVQWNANGIGVNGEDTDGADHTITVIRCIVNLPTPGNSQTVESVSFTLTDLTGHYDLRTETFKT